MPNLPVIERVGKGLLTVIMMMIMTTTTANGVFKWITYLNISLQNGHALLQFSLL